MSTENVSKENNKFDSVAFNKAFNEFIANELKVDITQNVLGSIKYQSLEDFFGAKKQLLDAFLKTNTGKVYANEKDIEKEAKISRDSIIRILLCTQIKIINSHDEFIQALNTIKAWSGKKFNIPYNIIRSMSHCVKKPPSEKGLLVFLEMYNQKNMDLNKTLKLLPNVLDDIKSEINSKETRQDKQNIFFDGITDLLLWSGQFTVNSEYESDKLLVKNRFFQIIEQIFERANNYGILDDAFANKMLKWLYTNLRFFYLQSSITGTDKNEINPNGNSKDIKSVQELLCMLKFKTNESYLKYLESCLTSLEQKNSKNKNNDILSDIKKLKSEVVVLNDKNNHAKNSQNSNTADNIAGNNSQSMNSKVKQLGDMVALIDFRSEVKSLTHNVNTLTKLKLSNEFLAKCRQLKNEVVQLDNQIKKLVKVDSNEIKKMGIKFEQLHDSYMQLDAENEIKQLDDKLDQLDLSNITNDKIGQLRSDVEALVNKTNELNKNENNKKQIGAEVKRLSLKYKVKSLIYNVNTLQPSGELLEKTQQLLSEIAQLDSKIKGSDASGSEQIENLSIEFRQLCDGYMQLDAENEIKRLDDKVNKLSFDDTDNNDIKQLQREVKVLNAKVNKLSKNEKNKEQIESLQIKLKELGYRIDKFDVENGIRQLDEKVNKLDNNTDGNNTDTNKIQQWRNEFEVLSGKVYKLSKNEKNKKQIEPLKIKLKELGDIIDKFDLENRIIRLDDKVNKLSLDDTDNSNIKQMQSEVKVLNVKVNKLSKNEKNKEQIEPLQIKLKEISDRIDELDAENGIRLLDNEVNEKVNELDLSKVCYFDIQQLWKKLDTLVEKANKLNKNENNKKQIESWQIDLTKISNKIDIKNKIKNLDDKVNKLGLNKITSNKIAKLKKRLDELVKTANELNKDKNNKKQIESLQMDIKEISNKIDVKNKIKQLGDKVDKLDSGNTTTEDTKQLKTEIEGLVDKTKELSENNQKQIGAKVDLLYLKYGVKSLTYNVNTLKPSGEFSEKTQQLSEEISHLNAQIEKLNESNDLKMKDLESKFKQLSDRYIQLGVENRIKQLEDKVDKLGNNTGNDEIKQLRKEVKALSKEINELDLDNENNENLEAKIKNIRDKISKFKNQDNNEVKSHESGGANSISVKERIIDKSDASAGMENKNINTNNSAINNKAEQKKIISVANIVTDTKKIDSTNSTNLTNINLTLQQTSAERNQPSNEITHDKNINDNFEQKNMEPKGNIIIDLSNPSNKLLSEENNNSVNHKEEQINTTVNLPIKDREELVNSLKALNGNDEQQRNEAITKWNRWDLIGARLHPDLLRDVDSLRQIRDRIDPEQNKIPWHMIANSLPEGFITNDNTEALKEIVDFGQKEEIRWDLIGARLHPDLLGDVDSLKQVRDRIDPEQNKIPWHMIVPFLPQNFITNVAELRHMKEVINFSSDSSETLKLKLNCPLCAKGYFKSFNQLDAYLVVNHFSDIRNNMEFGDIEYLLAKNSIAKFDVLEGMVKTENLIYRVGDFSVFKPGAFKDYNVNNKTDCKKLGLEYKTTGLYVFLALIGLPALGIPTFFYGKKAYQAYCFNCKIDGIKAAIIKNQQEFQKQKQAEQANSKANNPQKENQIENTVAKVEPVKVKLIKRADHMEKENTNPNIQTVTSNSKTSLANKKIIPIKDPIPQQETITTKAEEKNQNKSTDHMGIN